MICANTFIVNYKGLPVGEYNELRSHLNDIFFRMFVYVIAAVRMYEDLLITTFTCSWRWPITKAKPKPTAYKPWDVTICYQMQEVLFSLPIQWLRPGLAML